jgi:hypothetical protein
MSLEKGDLKRLVHNELHIDEFQSKLGDNKDVIVLSFKVAGKEPAADVGGFVEKGYDWILDADVSAGEMNDGNYIVFVEVPRDADAPDNIIAMMSDLMNLTEQDLDEWRVRYYHSTEEHALDKETLTKLIPLSPEEYERKYGRKEIDQLKNAAGVKVDTKAPKNEYTESLRVAAGIK